LRSLPDWFGIEESLLTYVSDVERLPTFVCRTASTQADAQAITGFLTLREHFPRAWEVHCLAVHADHRREGVGRALQRHVERWLVARDARFLQVKTIAATCDDPNYAETRKFYLEMGYTPLEIFPTLWNPHNPALQLVMSLS
jgi:GNAT superfamily N-acetyltransferase